MLTAGQTLAQHLNGMTADIQGLRSDAELGLSDAVNQANAAMREIAAINRQLALTNVQDSTTATLQDQRDLYIDQLSQLMDIKVVATDHNQVNIFTRSGAQLVGDRASILSFDAKGSLSAASLWSADPTKRAVGTITLDSGAGGTVDLIAANAFGSGKIAALLEMRDHVLVEAQAQVDQIAAGMASALSNKTTAGTAVTVGAQQGFDVDIGSLLAGNTINLTYTDTTTNTQKRITLMRVDDPSALPLPAERDRRSERQGGRHQFLRRHGVGVCADRKRARPRRISGLQSGRHDAARAEHRRRQHDACRRALDHHAR